MEANCWQLVGISSSVLQLHGHHKTKELDIRKIWVKCWPDDVEAISIRNVAYKPS